jgi:hypothetical protein
MRATRAVILACLAAAPAFAQTELPGQNPGPNETTAPEAEGHPVSEPTRPDSVNATPDYGGPAAPLPKKFQPLKFGGEAVFQVFPTSSATSMPSFFIGGRFLAGYAPFKLMRFSGMASLGLPVAFRRSYSTSTTSTSSSSPQIGLFGGLGAEATLELLPAVRPLARVNFDFAFFRTGSTLPADSLTFALGARFISVFDVYLSLGGDYCGGISVGLGLGIGKF